MKKELIGCFITSCIIIILLAIVLVGVGYLPLFEPCISMDYSCRPSSSIEESKRNNVLMWEYVPTVFQYNGTEIKITSAFVEQKYCRNKDGISRQRGFRLQVFFDDSKSWLYEGYNKTWLINDYGYAYQGWIIEEFEGLQEMSDSLVLNIREKHTPIDSLYNEDYDEQKTSTVWDTVQFITLFRKNE